MNLFYACVSLMFMDPTDKGPCVPITEPQSEAQCVVALLDWLGRAEAWRARTGVYYRPFGMCMPFDGVQA